MTCLSGLLVASVFLIYMISWIFKEIIVALNDIDIL